MLIAGFFHWMFCFWPGDSDEVYSDFVRGSERSEIFINCLLPYLLILVASLTQIIPPDTVCDFYTNGFIQ